MTTLFSAKPELRRICQWFFDNPRQKSGALTAAMESQGVNMRSSATVYRNIDACVDHGLLVRSGTTSGATYELTERARAFFLRDFLQSEPESRPRVTYNFSWLDCYEPNRTQYLSRRSLAELGARCAPGSMPTKLINAHDLSTFMCDLAYSSAALEGSQYNMLDTFKLVIMDTERTGGSAREKVLLLNHRDAVRSLIDTVRAGQPFAVTEENLRCLHALLSSDLLTNPDGVGNLRTTPVRIHGTAYVPLSDPAEIARAFQVMCEKAQQINNPFEQAFFISVHIPYLQPFEDANKRLARVACNAPLLSAGVTPIAWMGVESPTRTRDYHEAIGAVYERNDPTLFETMFVDCFLASAEKFRDMQRQKMPSNVSATYRNEVRATISHYIATGDVRVDPSVPPNEIQPFLRYVQTELNQLRSNPFMGARYGLKPGVLTAWFEKAAAARPEAIAALCEPDMAFETPRMRA